MPMIIDCHTHIYPDKIASRAVDSIGSFYGIPMTMDGTVDSLLRLMDRSGVDRALVCSAAVDAAHVRAVNDFLISAVNAHTDRLWGFGTLHADTPDPVDELRYIMDHGLRGVKLHPDMQHFALSDEKARGIWQACEHVCPVLIHTGDRRYHYSNPSMIPAIVRDFPSLVLICAHMGGYSEWDDPVMPLQGKNVYVDCSSSFFALPRDRMLDLFSRYGEDRILFGSDYPMWDMGCELEKLRDLGLSETAMQKILSGNLLKILGENA